MEPAVRQFKIPWFALAVWTEKLLGTMRRILLRPRRVCSVEGGCRSTSRKWLRRNDGRVVVAEVMGWQSLKPELEQAGKGDE